MSTAIRKSGPKKKKAPAKPARRASPPPALVKLALMGFALTTMVTVVQSSGVVARLFN